jgi:hypothetical protein
MSGMDKFSKPKFSNIWGNPFSKWQKSGDMSERLETLRVSGMVAERAACKVIAEKMKTQAPSLFFTENTPGAIGLFRKLDVNYFDQDDKRNKHIQFEKTKKVHFEAMQFKDIDELHGMDLRGAKFQSKLFVLLRSVGFLRASDTIRVEAESQEVDKDKFVGEMNGLIGSNGHMKNFAFVAGKILKLKVRIGNEMYEATVASTPEDQSAFIRWKHTESKSISLPRYVKEVCLIFNGRPKLTMELLNHPKIIQPSLSERNVGMSAVDDSFKRLLNVLFETVDTQIRNNSNPTLNFFNRRVPVTRYVSHETEFFRKGTDTFPYDSYMCHFSLCVHDMARMQYVYTILYSVIAALLRDYKEQSENKFSTSEFSWARLINVVKALIEERETVKGLGLRANIAYAVTFASSIYQSVCVGTADNLINSQLQNLHTTDCNLPAGTHHALQFGHLLATYAFENAPLHVVSNLETRNPTAVEKTMFGEQQKLYIMKLSLGDDNGPYNHGRRWCINTVVGSKREFFFDLEEIMIPGSKAQPGDQAQPPSEGYWCKRYDVTKEDHDVYQLERQSLISIKLNSTHEIELRLDVPYTDIRGVVLGDETKTVTCGPEALGWLNGEETGGLEADKGDEISGEGQEEGGAGAEQKDRGSQQESEAAAEEEDGDNPGERGSEDGGGSDSE